MYKICITNRHLVNGDFLKKIESIAQSDVDAIILREKDLDELSYQNLARKVIKICNSHNKLCILHNFYNVALRLKHPYIHLPMGKLREINNSRDIQLAWASAHSLRDFKVVGASAHSLEDVNALRKSANSLKDFKVVGVSAHSLEDVKYAEKMGADYVTLSHIFETDCKKGLEPKGLTFLKEITDQVDIKVYALGGINAQNAKLCIDAGADGVCLMSEYMK